MKWQLNICWQDIALFVSVMLLLLLPDMYFAVAHEEVGLRFVMYGIAFSLPLALLLAVVPSTWLRVVLLTCYSFVTLVEVLSAYTYYNFMNAICFSAFFYSASNETSDMSYYIIHSAGVHEILPLLLSIGGIILIIFGKKRIDLGKSVRWMISVVTSIVLMMMFSFGNIIFTHSPYHLVRELATAMQLEQERNDLLPLADEFSFRAQQESNDSIVCVLAIGESMNYSHCSLNGMYKRQTMPQMSNLDNLVCFSNYYANATYTQQAVPMLLTRATPKTFNDNYREKSIMTAFAEAGFKTCVISHRAQIINNGVHDYLAKDADTIIFVNSDREVVDAFKAICKEEKKIFVLMHFLGNHFFYSNYPEQYNVWTPNYTYSPEAKSDSLFVNAYDNSLLYVDSLLAASVHSLTDKSAVFLFTSDHGEYLDEHVGGHGLSCLPSKSEYHVPLMVWTSEQYCEIYPTKVENVQRHIDEPVCADHVFWSVLDMAGVEIDEELQQEKISIFGDTLLPHKRELLLPDGRTIIEIK